MLRLYKGSLWNKCSGFNLNFSQYTVTDDSRSLSWVLLIHKGKTICHHDVLCSCWPTENLWVQQNLSLEHSLPWCLKTKITLNLHCNLFIHPYSSIHSKLCFHILKLPNNGAYRAPTRYLLSTSEISNAGNRLLLIQLLTKEVTEETENNPDYCLCCPKPHGKPLLMKAIPTQLNEH